MEVAPRDLALIALRIIHIGSGVFWAGSIAFLTLILEPHYRAQGPEALRRTMRPLMPIMGPALLIASLATIASGAGIALVLGWGRLDVYLQTAWGRTILLGAAAAIAAFAVGAGLVRWQRWRLAALGESLARRTLEGDAPPPEEIRRVQQTEAWLWRLGRINFAFIVLAVIAMAIARYA